MGFFIVFIGFIILVGVISLIKKEFSNHNRSIGSHSNHASSHIDYSSTNSFVSIEDSNTDNCSDSVSSYSDTSSCSDSGASSD
ncbi:hypothetical protein C7Y47_18935 [Lysinibacillus sphaericus]|uniref:Uncharacterized protein n=1 Tax=Lysinibacillus sphaericus TaxID=1421 RepID=A0A544U9Z6_LYSSH|nr:hypothetical protein [Lysinibacillus sp. SDF0037]TQR28968.1 hypothetical protein C7Y47_18935 [Lysinibacillus sp. SDF0037]